MRKTTGKKCTGITKDLYEVIVRIIDDKLKDIKITRLEDIARIVLPGYLERHLKIQIPELERRFIQIDSKEVEINLYAEGKREEKEVIVVGECKSRVYEGDVEKFSSQIEGIERALSKEIIKVLFGYLIHPSAVREAEKKGILLVASYQR